MASYTKHIPPGGEGTVKLVVNTNGYGGRRLTKDATVYTNDPIKKELSLTITGMVDLVLRINPKQINLRGTLGDEIHSAVNIIMEKKYPFEIVAANTGSNTDYTVEKYPFEIVFKDGNGNEHFKYLLEKQSDRYVLSAENLMQIPGRYWHNIHLKTNSKFKPSISIPVSGDIKAETPPLKAPDNKK